MRGEDTTMRRQAIPFWANKDKSGGAAAPSEHVAKVRRYLQRQLHHLGLGAGYTILQRLHCELWPCYITYTVSAVESVPLPRSCHIRITAVRSQFGADHQLGHSKLWTGGKVAVQVWIYRSLQSYSLQYNLSLVWYDSILNL
ncbi:hypothetical protein J6590_040614 [Homalodisca vitripennis]|nr:hypothetical protein J6590_040614 [Homalodisca vitripennis]